MPRIRIKRKSLRALDGVALSIIPIINIKKGIETPLIEKKIETGTIEKKIEAKIEK